MKPDKITSYPAPENPTYICADDEGNHFVYIGEDTFSRLDDGPEKEHWMKKLRENKVTIAELGGVVTFNVQTGETILSHGDNWEPDDFGVEPQL